MSYGPWPPEHDRPMWLHIGNVYIAAIVSSKGKTVDVLGTFTEQEYFKLKLAGKTEDVLKKNWERWRKGQTPVLIRDTST